MTRWKFWAHSGNKLKAFRCELAALGALDVDRLELVRLENNHWALLERTPTALVAPLGGSLVEWSAPDLDDLLSSAYAVISQSLHPDDSTPQA